MDVQVSPAGRAGRWVGDSWAANGRSLRFGWLTGPLMEPNARHASAEIREDPGAPSGRFHVPRAWRAEDLYPGPEDAEVVRGRQTPDERVEEILDGLRGIGGPTEIGGEPIVLDVDREVPWLLVRRLLRGLMVVPGAPHPMRLRVARWPSGSPHYLGTRLRPCGRSEDQPPGVVVVRFAAAGADRLELTVANRSWSLPVEPAGFDDPAFLAQVNRAWDEVEAYLDGLDTSGGVARLESTGAGDGLWYAHVVTILDLLIGKGVRELELADDGACLTLDPPTGTTWPVRPAPVTGPMLLTAGIAVLLAFVITFLPLGVGRTRRRGSSRG